MDEKDKAERDFQKQFNDYDQTVDVVSCWQFLSDVVFKKSYFFRFGKFRAKDNLELTPDFAVAESENGKGAGPGSIVCDVKKLPNPYPEAADAAQQEMAYKIFGSSIEDVFKYGVTLSYASEYAKLPKLVFSEHDVELLTPEDTVDSVYKYLESKLGKKPFNVGRPLVLVSYYLQPSRSTRALRLQVEARRVKQPVFSSCSRRKNGRKESASEGFPNSFSQVQDSTHTL